MFYKVHLWAKSVKDYVNDFRKKLISFEEGSCIRKGGDGKRCGGEVIKWGTYLRWVVDKFDRYHIHVQRFFCKVCGRTFSVPPSFVVRWRRYSLTLLGPLFSKYGFLKETVEEFFNRFDVAGMLSAEADFGPDLFRIYLKKLKENTNDILSHVQARLCELNPGLDIHKDPRIIDSMHGDMDYLRRIVVVSEHIHKAIISSYPYMGGEGGHPFSSLNFVYMSSSGKRLF